MTAAVSLFTETRGILLDFDGPVCRLFSGYPASDIANELRTFLGQRVEATDQLPGSTDPLELLRWAGSHAPALMPTIEDIQTRAERKAAALATPTQGAGAFIAGAAERGIAVAIVSNNSAGAISHYLGLHGMTSYVTSIVGREPLKPSLMKPCPDMALWAAKKIAVPARTCVLIGDSPTDIEAARAAGVRSIGYAKHPNRVSVLSEAGAELVLESMTDVADVLVYDAHSGNEQ